MDIQVNSCSKKNRTFFFFFDFLCQEIVILIHMDQNVFEEERFGNMYGEKGVISCISKAAVNHKDSI